MTNDSSDRGPGAGMPGHGNTGAPGPVPPPAAPPSDSHGMNGFFAAIRRLGVTRSQDRWVGGVAGGLATRFGVDPLLVRGAVGVTMLMGFGFVLYGIAWALLPEQSDGRIHLEETLRGNFDIALLGAITMVVLGSGAGDWSFGWGPWNSGWFAGLAWVAAIIAGIVIVAGALRKRNEQRPPGAPGQAPTWQAPTWSATPPTPAAPQEGHPPMTTTLSSAAPSGPTWSSAGPVPPPPGRVWTPPPPVPPQPPRPPKPRPRGPGAVTTGVVVALILLGLAGLLWAERTGAYDGPIAAYVVGGGVVLVGLAIIVSGLRGRTAGGLTALAIVGMVVAGPAVAFGNWDRWHHEGDPFRDQDVSVTSREIANDGFSFGVGDATIDLTAVPLTDETLVVPISGGLGDVTVTVPEGAAVSATVSSGLGDVRWRVDGGQEYSGGFGNDRSFTSKALSDGRDAQIALEIDLGVGSVTIEEGRAGRLSTVPDAPTAPTAPNRETEED